MKAFRKVCASSSDFPLEPSLADKCFFYGGESIGQLLAAISRGEAGRQQIESKAALFGPEFPPSRVQQGERLTRMIVRALTTRSGRLGNGARRRNDGART